jgi:hypothetical protein
MALIRVPLRLLAVLVGVIGYLVVVPVVDIARSLARATARLIGRN